MEILRTCIRILFSQRRPESLLIDLDGDSRVSLDRYKFARLYQHYFPEMTLDQCLVSAEMAEKYYMASPEGANILKTARQRCVMNILLHFSKEALLEKNGYPVCRFEHLLRWHSLASYVGEDLLTTSYLASKDECSRYDRRCFDWPIVINHDDAQVNHLFTKKMADIHLHLKGSSGNFDLNWMALMNHVSNREKEFESLSNSQNTLLMLETTSILQPSLYSLAVMAAMIRVFLYKVYFKKSSVESDSSLRYLVENLESPETMYPFLADKVDDIVASARLLEGFSSNSFPVYDYVSNPSMADIKRNPNVILAGERELIYRCFRECYGGRMQSGHILMFYKYLLIKNRVRNELVQSNSIVGFKNFDNYDRRKSVFVERYPEYKNLLEPYALGLYFYEGKPRLVEPRIAPKDSLALLNDNISDIDKRVQGYFGSIENYGYVIHFIKAKDDNFNKMPVARHALLRDKVMRQAYYIDEFCRRSMYSSRILGIDAANSEILTRPEVFAQAFRFLCGERKTKLSGRENGDLGMTYHVGEDFMSLLDGLRAVDEVIHYMGFARGSRLGHAIVLGVDPERYLRSRHHTLLLKKHTLLDNIAWALTEYEEASHSMETVKYMKSVFRSVYRDVYGGEVNDGTIGDYYDAWLLRGDNPERYLQMDTSSDSEPYFGPMLTRWSHYDFNVDEAANKARRNPAARRLYQRYHYDVRVREKGKEIYSYNCPSGTEDVLVSLQKKIFRKVQSLGVGVESNPTSNVRIGGMSRYENHPIFKFFPVESGEDSVLASINTDDRGVFETSIEREFSLLACALYKKHSRNASNPDMRKTMAWLDELRENAIIQYFGNV